MQIYDKYAAAGSQHPECKHFVHSLLSCYITYDACSVSLSAVVSFWHKLLHVSHHEVAEKCPQSDVDFSQATDRVCGGLGYHVTMVHITAQLMYLRLSTKNCNYNYK